MKLSQCDLLLLQRHLDGELDAAATAAFATRLAAEPALQRAADEAQSVRGALAMAGAGRSMRPPTSFTSNLLVAARQLPTRQQLEQADVAAAAIGLCRRILLAAAILAGVGLAWHAGFVNGEQPTIMQANPADVQHEVDRLDALLQSRK